MPKEPAEEIARAMTRAAERSDVARLEDLWSSDFVLWYNTSLKSLSRDEALKSIAAVGSVFGELEFTDIRRLYGEKGYAQQHTIKGRFSGKSFSMPACVIVEISDGKVVRVDEWWDSAQEPKSNDG